MCTGLELLAMAAGGVGSAIEGAQARKQQDAIVSASNSRLNEFLDRNQQRQDESAALFDSRLKESEPAAVSQAETQAASQREAAATQAIDATAPAAAIPTKGSAASVIGSVYSDEGDKAINASKAKAKAGAKVASFGDALFGQEMSTANGGRQIGTIGGLASDDARMLPLYQDLASSAAAARHKPSGIGALLRAFGGAGGTYLGSL